MGGGLEASCWQQSCLHLSVEAVLSLILPCADGLGDRSHHPALLVSTKVPLLKPFLCGMVFCGLGWLLGLVLFASQAGLSAPLSSCPVVMAGSADGIRFGVVQGRNSLPRRAPPPGGCLVWLARSWNQSDCRFCYSWCTLTGSSESWQMKQNFWSGYLGQQTVGWLSHCLRINCSMVVCRT